ncbi:hypothetical protein [Paenibacillus sp. OK060]|nr:hypothetical protein [Paenibacillus sp. OK060]
MICETDEEIQMNELFKKVGTGMTTPPYPNIRPAVYNRENES